MDEIRLSEKGTNMSIKRTEMVGTEKDLTGKVFGKLIVIEYIGMIKGHHRWLCQCECGNKTVGRDWDLRNGVKSSCGCKRFERKYNIYDLTGEYGIGYTNNNEEFYFDLEDYDKIKDYTWYMSSTGYLMSDSDPEHRHCIMHRLIMNAPAEMEVDHIKGRSTTNDNRKENLRLVTHSQNNINKGLRSHNTSGTTGVCWDKKDKRWLARISVDKKNITLGYFINKDDAINARKEAEIKYHKEYAYNTNQDLNI